LIEVNQLTKTFGEQKVFKGISLQFPDHQCVFVIGKSGVGKSVLLKCMVGLMTPDEGSISVGGIPVETRDARTLSLVRQRCGLVFQFPALLDSVSVFENICFGLRVRGFLASESNIRDKVKENLFCVGLAEEILDCYPGELSFGVQKRVSIARTLAVEPQYVLFDEPTTGMDPVTTQGLNSLMRKLNRDKGMTTIVVSHDLKSAFAIADRIVLLDEGHVVFDGSPELFKVSEVKLARDFLAGVPHEA
jgi:phospholipid/cholesterol/gamma-HCH transport system ATP-binding protein